VILPGASRREQPCLTWNAVQECSRQISHLQEYERINISGFRPPWSWPLVTWSTVWVVGRMEPPGHMSGVYCSRAVSEPSTHPFSLRFYKPVSGGQPGLCVTLIYSCPLPFASKTALWHHLQPLSPGGPVWNCRDSR
jgi:hypothetical protein